MTLLFLTNLVSSYTFLVMVNLHLLLTLQSLADAWQTKFHCLQYTWWLPQTKLNLNYDYSSSCLLVLQIASGFAPTGMRLITTSRTHRFLSPHDLPAGHRMPYLAYSMKSTEQSTSQSHGKNQTVTSNTYAHLSFNACATNSKWTTDTIRYTRDAPSLKHTAEICTPNGNPMYSEPPENTTMDYF